jgi:hypothetical protein
LGLKRTKEVKVVFGGDISEFVGELIDAWRERNWKEDSNRLVLAGQAGVLSTCLTNLREMEPCLSGCVD